MNKIFTYIISSLFLVATFSCEKEANIKVPNQEAKLVVTCFISPIDTDVVVNLSLSKPIYAQSTNATVNDATVILSNGVNSIVIPYKNNTQGVYRASLSSFAISYNTSYYLTVNTPDGKSVSASTTVPPSQFPNFTVSQSVMTNANNNQTFNISCSVDDISGTNNYYRLTSANRQFDATTQTDTSTTSDYDVKFFNDSQHDGQTINASTSNFNYSSGSVPNYYRARRVILINCNKDYYLYNSTALNSGLSSDNPFGEPVIIYSNINGGYGCFGAYTARYKDIIY